jgi:response regulator of citrate/malate metabolism
MQNIAEIRRRHKINGESISSLAEEFRHSRTTIRKHLNSGSPYKSMQVEIFSDI